MTASYELLIICEMSKTCFTNEAYLTLILTLILISYGYAIACAEHLLCVCHSKAIAFANYVKSTSALFAIKSGFSPRLVFLQNAVKTICEVSGFATLQNRF